MSNPINITAIIVDDEKDSRETLRSYASTYCPHVTILAECQNIEEAKVAILKHAPQLVFLDIEMPRGNAFDLLEQFDKIDFEIIFITAFSEYALQAFALSASHYLLKPLNIEELETAVGEVAKQINNKDKLNRAEILLDNLTAVNNQNRKLVLPLMEGLEIVRMSEIMYCQAEDNFTNFHFVDGNRLMICRNLKFYESALEDFGFLRIHRSHIINLDYLKRYIKGKGGSVVLENGQELMVSHSKKNILLNKLNG